MDDSLSTAQESINADNFLEVQVEQNNLKYNLKIKSKKDTVEIILHDKKEFPTIYYSQKLNFQKIKCLNKVFGLFNSLKDFFDYLKKLSQNKKIGVKKLNDKIILILSIEVLLKQQEIEIELFPVKKDIDSNIKELYEELINIKKRITDNEELTKLKKEINELKNDNKVLISIIENQKNDIKILKDSLFNLMNKSVIMGDDEKSALLKEIEKKTSKKVKQLNKIYQATIDGGKPINFHNKCDNIPNTLVVIKSEENKRFGGFTPIPWKTEGNYADDNETKTFIFSLDYEEISLLKEFDKNAVYHYKDFGPCFGYKPDIGIMGNPLIEKKLRLSHWKHDSKENKNIQLIDNQGTNYIKALDYEIFQVIFD